MDLICGDQPTLPEARHDPQFWASLLSGIEELRTQDCDEADRTLRSWWTTLDFRSLSAALHFPPDPFLTLAFSAAAGIVETQLRVVQGTLQRLQEDALPFQEAMLQVARHFGDESRLRAWRGLLQDLLDLAAWLPRFQQALDYLRDAFFSTEELEERRKASLSAVEDGRRFLVGVERSEFDRRFLEFKMGYLEYYCSLHEESTQVSGLFAGSDSRVDVGGLRNLELLSQLPYTDKSYIHRVRLLGHWAQPNKCILPVRQILEQQPRCYCGFNPATAHRTADAARRINREIHEGVEYFRTLLRACREVIVEDLKSSRAPESTSRQIAILLSSGSVVQLKPQAIEALRRIFRRHPAMLLQQIRTASPLRDEAE